jgi:hypothetical protein
VRLGSGGNALCSTNVHVVRELKNFLAWEYLKIATLRALRLPFIAILEAFKKPSRHLLIFRLSMLIACCCGAFVHLSQGWHLSHWFCYGTRPHDGPFLSLIFASSIPQQPSAFFA